MTPDQARKVAEQAYTFAYPLVMYYRTMYMQAIDSTSSSYSGGFGKWLHLGLASPDDTDIVAPNNDTPYSYAWVDLRAEPWVLTMPKIDPDRFYTSQWDDLWGFVLDNVGSVEDGNDGASVLLASPSWEGELPDGVKRVVRGDSDFLGSLSRVQMIDQSDMDKATRIQHEYKLEPLSSFLGNSAPAPAPDINWPTWTEGLQDTDEFWSYANFVLSFTTPNPQDQPVLDSIAQIGIAPGQAWDASSFDKATADAISAGAKDAADALKNASQGSVDPSLFFRSRKDTDKDWFNRALGVFVGTFGNVKAQSVYFSVPTDADGDLFDASKHDYSMTFTADEMPPVKYFWSWTMYKLPQRWLVANSINRYSLGSAAPGLKTADDGSITIYFQAESPGKDRESNWLPTPNGPFWPVYRTYGPGEPLLDQTWDLPAIKKST